MTDDISIQELEEQDWDLSDDESDGIIEHEFMNGHEMQFKVQDPESEVIMEFIAPNPSGDQSRSEELFGLVQAAVVSPEVPIERWREMRTADQVMLSDKISTEIGIDRILGFHDGGLEEQLEDLLSESQESGTSE